jgi:ABC-type Fe3+ transport system substrate-binding protein
MRYFSLILLAVVLIAPFVLRAFTMDPEAKPVVEAGTRRLVIVTPHNQDIRKEFADRFDAWHRQKYGQGARIDYRVPGGTNDIVRLLDTTYNQYRDAEGKLPAQVPIDMDLVWGGGDFVFNVELKPRGILRPIPLPESTFREVFPIPTIAGIRLYDFAEKEGKLQPVQWVGVCIAAFGIVYNPGSMTALDLPSPVTWKDLSVPALAGNVALANPTSSGSAAVSYMAVLQRAMADADEAQVAARPELASLSLADRMKDPAYKAALSRGWSAGQSTLLLIAANARYFTDSATQPPNDVANGDAAAGMAVDFYGRTYEESLGRDRIRFVAPRAATTINPDPIAILHGVEGERLETATRFVDFLLTEDAQRLWILKAGTPGGPAERSLRRPPIRQSVFADRTNWSDDINPFEESGGFNQRQEWMGQFTEIRMIWAAAWIDSRAALKRAYTAALAIPDPAERSAAIARLADLPITLEEVEELTKTRRAQKPDDLDSWRARTRLALATRFRNHYEQIQSPAASTMP